MLFVEVTFLIIASFYNGRYMWMPRKESSETHYGALESRVVSFTHIKAYIL